MDPFCAGIVEARSGKGDGRAKAAIPISGGKQRQDQADNK